MVCEFAAVIYDRFFVNVAQNCIRSIWHAYSMDKYFPNIIYNILRSSTIHQPELHLNNDATHDCIGPQNQLIKLNSAVIKVVNIFVIEICRK